MIVAEKHNDVVAVAITVLLLLIFVHAKRSNQADGQQVTSRTPPLKGSDKEQPEGTRRCVKWVETGVDRRVVDGVHQF